MSCSLVARRDGDPARSDVQSGSCTAFRGLRNPVGSRAHYRFRVHADPHDHLPRAASSSERRCLDPQAHATDDPLVRSWTLILKRACGCVRSPLSPRQNTRADPRQHGRRRALPIRPSTVKCCSLWFSFSWFTDDMLSGMEFQPALDWWPLASLNSRIRLQGVYEEFADTGYFYTESRRVKVRFRYHCRREGLIYTTEELFICLGCNAARTRRLTSCLVLRRGKV